MASGSGARPPLVVSDASVGSLRVDEATRAAALRHVNRRPRLGLAWLVDWSRVLVLAVAMFVVVRAFLVEAYKIPSGSMERTLLVGDFLLVNKLVYGAEVPFTGRHLPRLREPRRGDVVVFQWPSDPSKSFVKRLVGMAGDTLAMRGGTLYVNGRAQAERYVTRTDPSADPVFEDFRWQRDYVVRSALARPARAAGALADDPPPLPLLPAPPARAGRPARDPGDHPSRNNWGPLIVPTAHYFVLGDNRDNSLDSRYWGFVPDSLLRGRPMVVYYSYAPDSARRLAWLTAVRWSRLGTRVR